MGTFGVPCLLGTKHPLQEQARKWLTRDGLGEIQLNLACVWAIGFRRVAAGSRNSFCVGL
ncbi:hypothetical protein RBWH47_00964 [Rhodopirellula baltica WH47]|uniref:Uncharacterized protein n=1 Tax=Rhodopirellula baltica WH47 TaxID=991778 RepID=F2AKJ2_RHOBT|nr:hypothetical protein RBWH47_00964 [Rhodopirellula baltica WH47]